MAAELDDGLGSFFKAESAGQKIGRANYRAESAGQKIGRANYRAESAGQKIGRANYRAESAGQISSTWPPNWMGFGDF